jgi:hypothetical protein
VDILGWLWWAISSAIGILWAVVWFLLGGWVSTLAQILVVVLVIFGMKYGWRQAPFEAWSRASAFARFAWGWIRAKDPGQAGAARAEVREVIRVVRIKERGDVNLSSILNLGLFGGLLLLAML